MRLHQLFDELPARYLPPEDPEITGIRHDSREVAPGDLFVAMTGESFDGRAFATGAAELGAVAAFGRGPAPDGLEVPWVEVEEPRRWLGPVSARLYGHPEERLKMVGVTGTNGKSTVATLIARMLEADGCPAGVLGTLGCHFRDISYPAGRTTREASEVFRILGEMRASGARAAVVEVSSHALVLGRLAGASFDVALFTNLTRDHLDFHGDLESYFAAKRRLFDQLKPAGRSVVSLGDGFGERLAAELEGPLTFGPGGAVSALEAELALDGTRGVIDTPRGRIRFRSPLIGRYNLENLVAAVAAGEALGLSHESITAAIGGQEPLAGRLDPVEAGQGFPAFIDFAHTPTALEALLSSVAELTEREIVLVFGCGGDRDQGKRVIMGRIAGRLAQVPVVTSDNPRGEDPEAILQMVEEGLRESGNTGYHLVADRGEAIRRAAALAAEREDAVLLVAGKGHQSEQIVGGERMPFSDREELEAVLSGAADGSVEVSHGRA
ncbi:MAG: UDP-N-acetylmuramoyl-L-alanyl-D-glutamate--2,6-diaminopimelate ligase [bacterium]|nr:UDP-N-acetylmuramoyl-L-alanyl-D-glutamate--2,6-diaminopimelate ligase [bacterium]